MRIAITYQHSLVLGGSERVLEILALMYPTADFFCMVADPKAIPPGLKGKKIYTTFLDRVPGAKRFYPYLLFACPIAVEALDLREYDLVISSDGSHTMGVLTREDALHLCYCHSPHRSLWDQYTTYIQSLPALVRPVFAVSAHYARQWNFSAAQRIDRFAANSKYIAGRIRKFYRRDSTVIYPPVDTGQGYIAPARGDYFLSVGRLMPMKRIDLLIEACNRTRQRLLIAGTGPAGKQLKSIAGPTIEFLGRVPDRDLPELYARCRAFLFASNEDFGIVPVEAQSYGRPVVAYGRGGSLETVRAFGQYHEPTGILFPSQNVESLTAALQEFERIEPQFDPHAIQRHAAQFDTSVFQTRMREFVDESLIGHGALDASAAWSGSSIAHDQR